MPKFNADQILSKVVNYGDKLLGHSAGKFENAANVMARAEGMGIKGVSAKAITGSRKLADNSRKESNMARLKTGVGAAALAGGGFLGLHKYHQHKDNKILERIDRNFKSG